MGIRPVTLSEEGEDAVKKLREYLAKVKEKYGEERYEDKEKFDLLRLVVPRYKEDVKEIVEKLSKALGSPKTLASVILRTKTLGKSLTGPNKVQYFVSLERRGEIDPRINDAIKTFPFQPYASYDSPEPTYIHGGVEFIVLWDDEADNEALDVKK